MRARRAIWGCLIGGGAGVTLFLAYLVLDGVAHARGWW